MRRRSASPYDSRWPAIARKVKSEAGWQCVRCEEPHDAEKGYVLTVHHLDMNPANNCWWNLAPLCQRCHLHVQAKVVMARTWMFEHSKWFKPYVAGYYATRYGYPDERRHVMANLDFYLGLEYLSPRNDRRLPFGGEVDERGKID